LRKDLLSLRRRHQGSRGTSSPLGMRNRRSVPPRGQLPYIAARVRLGRSVAADSSAMETGSEATEAGVEEPPVESRVEKPPIKSSVEEAQVELKVEEPPVKSRIEKPAVEVAVEPAEAMVEHPPVKVGMEPAVVEAAVLVLRGTCDRKPQEGHRTEHDRERDFTHDAPFLWSENASTGSCLMRNACQLPTPALSFVDSASHIISCDGAWLGDRVGGVGQGQEHASPHFG
jgi:hypothetical protein